jgi:hypothetical protein
MAEKKFNLKIQESPGVFLLHENRIDYEGQHEQEIRIKVAVADGDLSYLIPVSGNGQTGFTNSWWVDWGDGALTQEIVTPSVAADAVAPSHTYAAAGEYWITIRPAGSLDAWARCFGYNTNTAALHNAQANKNKLVEIDYAITPEITRTAAQIIQSTSTGLPWELFHTFNNCRMLRSMGNTRFSRRWDDIIAVASYFMQETFLNCYHDDFDMSPYFTWPKNIITMGGYYCGLNTWANCRGRKFSMNDIYNLPQNTTGNPNGGFIQGHFEGCSGLRFNMNNIFQIPPNASLVILGANLFWYCKSIEESIFEINDVFTIPKRESSITDISLRQMFALSVYGGTPRQQKRTAASIINGNPAPSTPRVVFSPDATVWSDYASIDANWRTSA